MDLTRAINRQLWLEKLPWIHAKDKVSCNHKVIKVPVKAVCLETEIRGLKHCPSGSNMPVESEWHKVGTHSCRCEENSPCKMDLFLRPCCKAVSLMEMTWNPLEHQ